MKVVILGLGQIGGSLGRDLINRGLVAEVIGYDKEPSVLRRGRTIGAIDRSTSSLESAIRLADLIVVALPIGVTLKFLPGITRLLTSKQAILDVTSTKAVIFECLNNCPPCNYISGHPLAGNEGVGLAASRLDMFDRMPFALLPHENCDSIWVKRIDLLIRKLGSRTFTIDPIRHDYLTSLSIQTPYFLAYLLSRMAIRQTNEDSSFWDLSGGSIRGAMRVMKSSDELTHDMLWTNRENIIGRIDELSRELKTLKSLLSHDSPNELRRQLRSTRQKLLKSS